MLEVSSRLFSDAFADATSSGGSGEFPHGAGSFMIYMSFMMTWAYVLVETVGPNRGIVKLKSNLY